MQHRHLAALLATLLGATVLAGCGEAAKDSARDSDASAPTVKRSSPSTPPTTPPSTEPPSADDQLQSFRITVADGRVRGGIRALRATAGETVRLTVTSDADDEVHVHGVDEVLDLRAGVAASMTFPVSDPGSYEIELHDSGLILGTLEVR